MPKPWIRLHSPDSSTRSSLKKFTGIQSGTKCDISNSHISADEASGLPEMLTCISC